MGTLSAFILLAAVSAGPAVEHVKTDAPATQVKLVEIPKKPDSLTLYNEKGEVVARCDKKDDSFGNCKLAPGTTLDDVMNAWVHAYQDLAK